ncbi:glutamate--tRNA ligase [Helicobacter sp. MIT 14-3879]|uniref:glutamate--tRNA ligase n=1 Tax=Helicobacter sp. MIT 14-3879 TaxID=2040649 RepID=UPI000E1F72AB|nr:glutamate--tRNA ligase [Helicobacter sp. MIT 14-3879]RDU65419.1 glutamate--tRNA ligase [Helicobacter sp. MIT 14-3879]
MLRFAPSPTGDMHIGNLRVAILNYIIAKQLKQDFLIRIEDTDKNRNIKGKDKEILSLLNLFGLFWDRLVYQSDNFKQHNIIANELIKNNKAFYCYATKEFLEQKKQEAIEQKKAFRYKDSWALVCRDENLNPSIRLKGASSNIKFYDEIKGECEFNQNEIDSFVIIRDDGVPTYNFACSVDDMLYDINFIIRGEDHTSNTPKQILIRKFIGYDKKIKYAHLPIILNKDGKKMSKRDNESSVKWLLEQGYLPKAILNYLLLMGNKTKEEIFTLNEAIKWFDLSKLSKSPVRFDIDQLRYINREHLKRLNEKDMALLLESNDLSIGALGKIYLEESSTLNEIRDKIEKIISKKVIIDEVKIYEDKILLLRGIIIGLIENNSDVLNDFNTFKKEVSKISNLKGKELFMPLRFLLTGALNGPHLNDLYPYLRFYLKDIIGD